VKAKQLRELAEDFRGFSENILRIAERAPVEEKRVWYRAYVERADIAKRYDEEARRKC
jgi:hypothetical protein